MSVNDDWQLGPFKRDDRAILAADPHLIFRCPVSGCEVQWAAKDVFNAGAIVRNDRVCLLFRAEDKVGRYAGVSRIGLATSADGVNFTVEPKPVLYPDNDPWQAWEWPGGCEDPRIVESPEGGYVCHYSAFDGKFGALFVATSPDLRHWTKHGPAFAGTRHVKRWSKSGAVVTEIRDGRLIAARIDGRYWMYWGEGVCFAATSSDLLHWQPVEFDGAPDHYISLKQNTGQGSWESHHLPGQPALRPLLFPRPGRFDSGLVEPGPPALLTKHGIVLIYNGSNHPQRGDPAIPPGAYQPGQVLFDARDPAAYIARPDDPFLRAQRADETVGQYNNVCFAQGLVLFRGQWILYYGMADSRIGSARAPWNPD